MQITAFYMMKGEKTLQIKKSCRGAAF